MRATVQISAATLGLMLAACSPSQSGSNPPDAAAPTSTPPQSQAATPANEMPRDANTAQTAASDATTAQTVASDAATETAKGDWASLDALVGKNARDSGLLDKSAISADLHKLLGAKFDVFKANVATQTPLQREGSVLYFSGNAYGKGGSDAGYLLIDSKSKALEAGLWEGGKLATYKTPGSNITKPKDIATLISNN